MIFIKQLKKNLLRVMWLLPKLKRKISQTPFRQQQVQHKIHPPAVRKGVKKSVVQGNGCPYRASGLLEQIDVSLRRRAVASSSALTPETNQINIYKSQLYK